MLIMLDDINLVALVFSSLVIWSVFLITETMQRRFRLGAENARKIIHILSGFFFASMPTFSSRADIVAFGALFLVGVLLFDGYFYRFSALRDVRRWTLGQYLYPLAIILTAVLFDDPIVISFSILILALADGFAAVIGQRFGRAHYHLFGADKTYLGSSVFFLVSLAVMFLYLAAYGTNDVLSVLLAISGAFSLTLVEGCVCSGLDNLLVPPLTGMILMAL